MRASSLSNDQVVSLVSKYFVPVWLSVDDFELEKKEPAEANELSRLQRLAKKQGLASGTVQVYLIRPDGTLAATMHVAEAAKPDKLMPLLQEFIKKEELKPRSLEAVKASAAPAKKAPCCKAEGGVMLHVATRHKGPRANWGLGENWLELSAAEWPAFIPFENARPGSSWEIDAGVAAKLFRYFFPPTPNYDSKNSELSKASLTATVVAATASETRVALRGHLEMKHNLGGKTTDGLAKAKLAGAVTFDRQKKKITSFQLVSLEADFLWHWQGKPQPSKFEVLVELAP